MLSHTPAPVMHAARTVSAYLRTTEEHPSWEAGYEAMQRTWFIRPNASEVVFAVLDNLAEGE